MRRVLRGLIALVVTALAVLFGFGCLLAALFEMQGFGGDGDRGPRPLYLASLAVGFILCVAAPFVAERLLRRFLADA